MTYETGMPAQLGPSDVLRGVITEVTRYPSHQSVTVALSYERYARAVQEGKQAVVLPDTAYEEQGTKVVVMVFTDASLPVLLR